MCTQILSQKKCGACKCVMCTEPSMCVWYVEGVWVCDVCTQSPGVQGVCACVCGVGMWCGDVHTEPVCIVCVAFEGCGCVMQAHRAGVCSVFLCVKGGVGV